MVLGIGSYLGQSHVVAYIQKQKKKRDFTHRVYYLRTWRRMAIKLVITVHIKSHYALNCVIWLTSDKTALHASCVVSL
jgi:hypothetical protein